MTITQVAPFFVFIFRKTQKNFFISINSITFVLSNKKNNQLCV